MNNNTMNQVFSHYIENFAMINNEEHGEYYKWQICHEFPQLMDEALAAPEDEFASALYKVKVCTENIIDSFTQPFYGLVKFAEEEPETVRQMFIDLYEPDGGSLQVQMEQIEDFFNRSNELLEKYYPDSYLYKQNSHSVSAYLFLYDPENHYMYKASECNTMADCIGFYDDWGSGDNIKLDVFYRMCDEIVEEIKKCPELLKTNESRYDGSLNFKPGKLHDDVNKHILLFDIIYCCKVYDLFGIIPFARPNTKEKKLIIEYREKANSLKKAYDEAKEHAAELEQALDYFSTVVKVGEVVVHKKYGEGKITQINSQYIFIDFPSQGEVKQLGLPVVIANGIVRYNVADFDERLAKYKGVISKASSIPKQLDFAARALEPYEEYLV